MNYRGISTETLEESLNVYSERLTDWNTTEGKRRQYITRVDEIASELYRRYEEKNVRARHARNLGLE